MVIYFSQSSAWLVVVFRRFEVRADDTHSESLDAKHCYSPGQGRRTKMPSHHRVRTISTPTERQRRNEKKKKERKAARDGGDFNQEKYEITCALGDVVKLAVEMGAGGIGLYA